MHWLGTFRIALVSLTLLSSTSSTPQLFTYDDILGYDAYKRTIHRAFPNVETCVFHLNGKVMTAVLRDKTQKRLILVMQPNAGEITIKHNGFPIDPASLKPASVFLMAQMHTAEGVQHDPTQLESFALGHWLPFSLKDTLHIEGKFSGRTTTSYTISYTPNSGWGSQISQPVFAEGEPRKYDAWHFSEDQLIDDIAAVLTRKASCKVALRQGYRITVKRWKPEPDAMLSPMEISLTKKIILNFTHAPNEALSHQERLRERLEAYATAARAGGMQPKIHLRFTPKANDLLLHDTLITMSKSGIRTVHLEDQRKETK